MGINKRIYIDYYKILEIIEKMGESGFIHFLNKRVVIPTDDEAYEYLMRIKKENKIIVKKSDNN
jgi:hypothetical protein